jgi:pyridoxamine 5'-phosphate oxidase
MEILRGEDPILLFRRWLEDAGKSEPNDPEAVALATADAQGRPSARMVLMKGVDARGFRFFTNMESDKGRDLAANPHAALCFHWKSLRRQVRVTGRAEPLPRADVAAYFSTRHPLSRLGAWASAQSRPLESRAALEARVAAYAEKYKDGDIPCPPYWGGYVLVPDSIEFWQQGEGRLHDRFVFTREDSGGGWNLTRLNP